MQANGDLSDEVILVTGATDGLGRAVAIELARRGATLVVHGRSDQRGRQLMAEITQGTGNDRVHWVRADFAELDQVRGLAERVVLEHPGLTVVLNNAGLGVDPVRHTSLDGHELTFQVDYLAPYMLSYLLAPVLIATPRARPKRIVAVASAGQAPIDFDDVMLSRGFDGVQAYCQAKLAEVMLTFDLAEHLPAEVVTANCLHPASMMPTKIVTHMFTPTSTLAEGVASTVRVVTDPELEGVTGRYYDRAAESRAHRQAYDQDARRRLREVAGELTGVAPRTTAGWVA